MMVGEQALLRGREVVKSVPRPSPTSRILYGRVYVELVLGSILGWLV